MSTWTTQALKTLKNQAPKSGSRHGLKQAMLWKAFGTVT